MIKRNKTSKKETILNVLGWIFLFLGLASITWYVKFQNWRYAVWFCNHSMIIAGIAVLCRNRFWLTAMLNWSLIPVTAWVVDFLCKIIFGIHLLGITEYMFTGSFWMHLISLQHLFTVPLMLFALHLLGKPAPLAWIGTTIHGTILWLISYFLITPDYNINCAHHACVTMNWLPDYVVMWPIVAFVMFFSTNKFLCWVFSALKARHQQR